MRQTIDAASPAYTSAATAPLDTHHRDRRFFTRTTIVLALLFAAGFSWSTFVRTRPGAVAFGGPNLLPVVRWHAAVMTVWMLFLLLQTSLVAKHRTNLHRRLGIFGGFLAVAVILSGWLVTFHARPLSTATTPFFLPAPASLQFAFIPTEELIVFTILTALGLYLRRSSAAHKRLILLGALTLVTAGTTRIPLPPILFFMTWYGVPEAIVVVLLMRHDWRMRQRIHPATLWGGALVLVGAVTRFWIAHTDIWSAIAARLSS